MESKIVSPCYAASVIEILFRKICFQGKEKRWTRSSSSRCPKLDQEAESTWWSECRRGMTFRAPGSCLIMSNVSGLEQPWLAMSMILFIARSWQLLYVTCNPRTLQLNQLYRRIWMLLWHATVWKMWIWRDSWQTTPKRIEIQYTLSMEKHTKADIRQDLQAQHRRLCQQYKNAKSMTEAETKYLVIRVW